MDFRRVDALPPYAFAEVERLKLELRRAGEDVIDLGFGNPDVPPPEIAVEKLREAALLPRNHRYSSSRGLPKLREAICDLYRDRFGVELDPETEATLALGAKEGLVHLLWVLLGPGDVALVPSPSYPIHLFAPGFAGAAVQRVPVGPGVDFLAGVAGGMAGVAAAAARAPLLVPAQPDDRLRRPRADAAARRLRTRAGARARARLRVRRPRVRRLHAAVDLRSRRERARSRSSCTR